MFAHFPFLVDQAAPFGVVAAITWPALIIWAGLAFVVLCSWKGWGPAPNTSLRPPFSAWLALLAALPLGMLVIGSAFWEEAGSRPYSHPAAVALCVLALFEVLCAYALVWKLRIRKLLALTTSIAGIVWGLGAFFVAGFAVSGTWP